MATIKGKLKTKSGDIMYPETSADKVTGLATVATSGSYADLTNKPTIPSDVKVRQYQCGDNAAGTSPNYPILTRYNLTNKNGSYDNSYARYHTGVTINTTTGALNAPAITVNGNAVLTSHQSLSNYVTLNGAQTISGVKTFSAGPVLNNGKYLTVKNTSNSTYTVLGMDSNNILQLGNASNALCLNASGMVRPHANGSVNLGNSGFRWKNLYVSDGISDGTNTLTLPNKSGTIALTSDISQAKCYKHNISVYFSGYTTTTGGANTLATFLIQFEFIDTQANINTWSELVARMLNSFPNYTEVRFPCSGWIRYQSDGFYYFVTSLTREGSQILINGKAANASLGDIYVYLNGSETVNYYNKTTEIAVPAVMTNYAPATVWSGSVTQSGGSRTLSDLSGSSTLDDGIWRITVTYQGSTIGITLLIADGKGYGYGGESSMGSYNVYMVGLQYENGTFWARGTTFKGSSNDHSSGSVTDIAFQATITYKKIERLVAF